MGGGEVMAKQFKFLVFGFLVISLGCSQKNEEGAFTLSETSGNAQQIGDVLASIDESGGVNGSYAFFDFKGQQKFFARIIPDSHLPSLSNYFLPSAFAASCAVSNTWGACTSNVIIRNFNDCTIGTATLSGTVTLTFNDGAVNNICAVSADGHSIVRNPDFTLTGQNGAQFVVSKTGTSGQTVTRTSSGNFQFTNDGIRRVVTFNGSTLFDATTSTTSPLSIAGNVRNGRVVNGGNIRVTNNLSSVTCDYVPASLTWGSSCNCPVSGSLSGTCSDGRSTSITVTSCGEADITLGSTTEAVTLDRCAGI